VATYYATVVASYDADNEVEARLIAETVRENAGRDLDESEGSTDEVWVDQVVAVLGDLSPIAVIQRLKITRNDLIRLRKNDCFDTARELDKIAWALEQGQSSEYASYDYGKFLEVAKTVLEGQDIL